jgi:pimeloyl-ACP methyl ester carboxylesterase
LIEASTFELEAAVIELYKAVSSALEGEREVARRYVERADLILRCEFPSDGAGLKMRFERTTGTGKWQQPTLLNARTFSSPRHTTRYWEAGPANGPLIMFLHGWPQIGLMWRAQVEAFASEGWHCVAPDMRGYGGSSTPTDSEAYALKEIVEDMVQLHDHLGARPAIWVGHDWGSPVAGALAAHHPKRSRGVVITANGGRYGSAHRAPPTAPDPALWPSADFDALVEAFRVTGFRPRDYVARTPAIPVLNHRQAL